MNSELKFSVHLLSTIRPVRPISTTTTSRRRCVAGPLLQHVRRGRAKLRPQAKKRPKTPPDCCAVCGAVHPFPSTCVRVVPCADFRDEPDVDPRVAVSPF